MAQQVQVHLIDDIDGGVAETTVHFGLDGAEYEIDLSPANEENLRNALRRYVEAGRKMSSWRQSRGKGSRARGGTRATGQRGTPDTTAAQADSLNKEEVRAWARQQGLAVKDRGRIPSSVIAEYLNFRRNGANGSASAPAAETQEPATVKSGPARSASAGAASAGAGKPRGSRQAKPAAESVPA